MTPETQYNRTIAHFNMTDEVHANCEECGAAIPVELALCDDCVYAAEVGEPDHNNEVLCCPDCERPNQFGELCAACQREQESTLLSNSDADFRDRD